MKTLELLPPAETMYRALVNRDSSFEGIFYIGVRTTGIFCRPTCSAKKPARENVDFFATSTDALESGYRPCLRCHPLDPNARPPKLIERLTPDLDEAKEIARGNQAVADYYGRVVGAAILGVSLVVAAAVLGGTLAALH